MAAKGKGPDMGGSMVRALAAATDGLNDAFDLVERLEAMAAAKPGDGDELKGFKARLRRRLDDYGGSQQELLQRLLSALYDARTASGDRPPQRGGGKEAPHGGS